MKMFVKTCDYDLVMDNIPGKDISEILYESGLILNRRCGGDGTCGGCNVVLEEGEFVVGEKVVSPTATRHRNALACRTRATSESCVVRVPSRSRIEVNGSIEEEFQLGDYQLDPPIKKIGIAVSLPSLTDHRSDQERIVDELCRSTGLKAVEVPLDMIRQLSKVLSRNEERLTATMAAIDDRWQMIAVEEGDSNGSNYGLALDIGTTTVAGILIDLTSGKVLQKASRYNQQLAIADDVASRISSAKSAKNIERLQKLLVLDTINPIINSVCHAEEIEREDISRIAVAGNTVMIHLLLGLDVTNIGKLPFNPVLRLPSSIRAGQLGINGNGNTPLDIIPAIAGYVGGDITADIYVAEMQSQPDGTLMVDLGTNGEMVLKENGELVGCATPAGPAFEGGGLLHGCRASEGAIERIAIGPNLLFTVGCIGSRDATGICGSAIIDFIAEGYRCGLISEAGRMDVEMLKRHNRYAQVEVEGRPVNACVVIPVEQAHGDNPILITEADIAEILQAKSAIFAGIKTLLEHRGQSLDSITQLILAGGFAKHINIDNAICIGLLPRLPEDRISVIGNGALGGAYLTLVDSRAGEAMRELYTRPQVIELNLVDSFESNFVQSLYLPEIATAM